MYLHVELTTMIVADSLHDIFAYSKTFSLYDKLQLFLILDDVCYRTKLNLQYLATSDFLCA